MTDYIIITGESCLWCDKAKAALREAGKTYVELSLDEHPDLFVIMKALSAKTVPQVLKIVGGFEATVRDLGEPK